VTWIQTFSGRRIDFLNPDPYEIDLLDVGIALSRIPRFCGATKAFYSVAQHSCLVYQIVRDNHPDDHAAALWALLHDAHEYVMGDMPAPLKYAIRQLVPSFMPNPVKTIEDNLDIAIVAQLGMDPHDVFASKKIVGHADLVALATERAQLLLHHVPWDDELPEPHDFEIVPMKPSAAEQLWRGCLDRAADRYVALRAPATEAAE
jgi:hypothetical protein